MDSPCITWAHPHGEEELTLAEFRDVIDDDEAALAVAQRMLDGDTPVAWQENGPDETFDLLDGDELREQMEATEQAWGDGTSEENLDETADMMSDDEDDE